MSGNCVNKNPLQRSGVSQYQRVLNALLPETVPVDQRANEDLILFAKNYASYLNYYNSSNEIDGNWTPLMRMDVSVVLATIIKQNTKKYSQYLTDMYAYIGEQAATTAAGKADVKKHYKNIYDFIYTLFYQYNEFLTDLPKDYEFTTYLETMIESKLSSLYLKIDKYYENSAAANLFDATITDISQDPKPPFQPTSVAILKQKSLNALWLSDSSSQDVVDFDPEFPGTTEVNKIKNVVQHNLFKGLLEQVIKTFTNILSVAEDYFDKTLEDFPTHTPHYALFITFIKLFKYAQNDLNTFTEKHLDYYYKEVLQLGLKAAEPDNAHLVFELTKNGNPSLLAAGTPFKAGKDADSKELFYTLTDDIVVNSGVVKSLKAVYSETNSTSEMSIYASEIVNSSDGKGGELTNADKSWRPFGTDQSDTANIGFAIAHPNLLLQEGVRTITITFKFDSDLEIEDLATLQGIKAQLTSAKEWIDATIDSIVIDSVRSNYLVITLTLGLDKGAATKYEEEIHLMQLNTELPVIKFLLNYEISKHSAVSVFSKYNLNTIKLNVDVVGLKSLALQNEVSQLDPAKPFPLFSFTPHIGSSFIIGSNEAFLKNNYGKVTAKLNLEWDHIDKLSIGDAGVGVSSFGNKTIEISYLHNGNWTLDSSASDQIFTHSNPATHNTVGDLQLHVFKDEVLEFKVPKFSCDYKLEENKNYDINSRNGYVKIEFKGPTDFGHSTYVKRMTQAAISKTTVPSEPYTPSVKAISLNYNTTASIDLSLDTEDAVNDKHGRFFHVQAFGTEQKHRSFTARHAAFGMLPEFFNEGELFIGIEKFAPSQNINILFKVSEGSADPTKDIQDIDWYYLSSNNQWRVFDVDSLIDETNSLTKTGIIKFPFPADATDTNNLMGETLFWIRATVKKDTLALCSLIQLHAQAGKVVFNDYKVIGNYFKAILPAETISKMVISNASIKKISQPYASFDGKIKEENSTFYNRVSERLRHKQRAITIWDYERLTLENFPQLYKVKCINHTEVRMNSTPAIDNELAPGHVLIVPVPSLNNKNAVDPLKPQTDLGTLVEIEHYLRQYTSPHVRLQVKNAKFEEIQLDFKVKFLSDDTAYYHDVLLADIEQYLSPWAYDAATDIEFGGRITKSVLINFIEERSYVDYLTCFKMFHIIDGSKSGDVEDAIATTSRSVFVSYAGNESLNDPKHIIDYLTVDCNC